MNKRKNGHYNSAHNYSNIEKEAGIIVLCKRSGCRTSIRIIKEILCHLPVSFQKNSINHNLTEN